MDGWNNPKHENCEKQELVAGTIKKEVWRRILWETVAQFGFSAPIIILIMVIFIISFLNEAVIGIYTKKCIHVFLNREALGENLHCYNYATANLFERGLKALKLVLAGLQVTLHRVMAYSLWLPIQGFCCSSLFLYCHNHYP